MTAQPNSPCADPVSSQITVVFVLEPDVEAGTSSPICETGGYLTGSSLSNTASFTWIGNGNFAPALDPADPSTVFYTPTPAEINAGEATVVLRGYPVNGCGNFVDDSRTLNIENLPSVNLNNSADLCEDDASYTFSNSDYTALPTPGTYSTFSWDHNGNGSISNGTTLFPTYTPGAGDTAVNITLTLDPAGNCGQSFSEIITLNYYANPTINAGSDITTCATAGDDIPLNQGSSSSNNLTYQWSSPTGGTFTDQTALTTIYQPNATDISNGSVVLTLRGTSPAPCNKVVLSTLTVNFSSQPSVSVTNGTQACFGSPITLNATGTFDNITWSTNGNGNLNGNIYTPVEDDLNLASVNFIAQVSNNNNCGSTNADIDIIIIPEITVDAGPTNLSVCQSENQVNLSGIITGNPDSVSWTKPLNSDSTLTSNNTSDTILNIGPIDRAAGTLNLSLSAIRGGTCPVNQSDQITLIFTESISVDAGNDITNCGQVPIDLDNVTVSSNQNVSYQWSSDGTGSFDNSTDLNTIYRPSLADLSGTVSLVITVTKTDNGCDNIVSDTIIVSFTQGTTIDAGGDLTACQGPGVTIQPDGSVLNADSYYWSSGGSGSFNGTETNEDPTYSPSNADYQAGQVSLTLIATTAGECEGIITETIFVTLYQAPVFSIDEDADNDGEIFICSSAETININASLNVSQTSVSNLNWSGGVDGNFISGGQTFNATYRFGANEKTNGSVTLRLDADGENGCANPDQKVVIVTFLDPIANPLLKI